jgi:outer membrane cobalamin receptor
MKMLYFIIILFFIPVLLCAQTDTAKTYNIDPITVTATRTATARSVVAPSISIIPQEVLTANPEKSILSLVSQQVPGVFVQERGILGFGVSTSKAGNISIRGVGGDPSTEVLMMIDGRPQFMGLMGHPLADSYLSANVERVEVIRGPASVLYGSNAMGGVINIITHSTQTSGLSGDVSLEYGSFNSQHLGGKVGYQTDMWNTLASFTHEHTDGYHPQSEFNATSGYFNAATNVNEQVSVIIDGSITGFTTYDPGPIYAPKTKNNYVDIQRGYTGLSIDNDLGVSKGSTRFVYNFGHNEVFDGSNWVSDDYNAIFSAYQTLKFLPDNALTLGFDLNKFGGNGKNNTKDYGTHSVFEYAFYVNIQQSLLERFTLNGGLRYDHNELFGAEIVPQVGASYHASDATTLRASVSKGFRSPTIRELYLFPAPTPTLRPERLWNYEIGAIQSIGDRFSDELTVFQSEAQNLILLSGQYPNMKLSNSGSFISRGIEFSGTYLPPIDHAQLHVSYSFSDESKQVPLAPKHKLFLSGQYTYGITVVDLSVQHVEHVYSLDNQNLLHLLPNYSVVNARISVRIQSRVSVSLSFNNLLDKNYQSMYGYPMPGNTTNVGLQASL